MCPMSLESVVCQKRVHSASELALQLRVLDAALRWDAL